LEFEGLGEYCVLSIKNILFNFGLKENITKKHCFFWGKVFLNFEKWTKINVQK
jgi:hypothetical protein